MKTGVANIFSAVACVFVLTLTTSSFAHPLAGADTPRFYINDTTPAPVKDRYGDPFLYPNKNPFYLKDTSFIKRNIEYDPVTKQYYVIEKIGGKNYRTPMTFSMEEFLKLKGQEDENDYFKKRSSLLTNLNRRSYKPKFNFLDSWVNRIVGNGKVEIKPNGYIDMKAGYQGQKINNPTLPERARKNGGLDFDMSSQFQLDANIGDKLKLPINYNTLSTFNFENQLKLDYVGQSDEILKIFQAGNVSFNSKGTLIPSANELFGLKTQLQFGKLFITTVLGNQRSQRQSLGLQGGTSIQPISMRADEYEENRHFLMSQYFRNNYNKAMKDLPVVNSLVQILRTEVWVTNRTGATTETRDVVGLMDLGERNPFNPSFPGSGNDFPRNNANTLYQSILSNPNARSSTNVQSALTGLGLSPVQEFEKTFARKLSPSDYYFNPQIGFVSLTQPLQPDEVLAVAFQYTYNGQVYQVGEFSTDVPPDSTGTTQPVLFLKLLKATSQRTNLPIWDLMMKNVYSAGFGQLERDGFEMNITYEEPSLGEKRYLPSDDVDPAYKGQPLITLLNLDRLNNQNDPQPDGQFDYIEGFTVLSSQSRIIFPVLEPFGKDLEYVFPTQAAKDKYIYYPLYDTIKAIAQTYANLNRYKIVGRSKTASQGDYQLGFNIPKGSVTVTAGGQVLRENIDYEINYDLGSLRVINQAIINSGVPVDVQYENNALFGTQQKNFLATRFDYLVNKKLSIGATIARLGERPFFTKQSYGEDPVRNTMYGLDVDYRNEIPRLSKWLDKLPFYTAKGTSSIAAYAEAAVLKPGHAKQIGKGNGGVIYIDDFEGTRNSIDLRFPIIDWTLASAPQKALDKNGNVLFPEAELSNDLSYGYNRAKIAWYNIEQVMQESRNTNNPIRSNLDELSKPETRLVSQKEVFPNRSLDFGQGNLTTFDMAFYPNEKGPYNFESRTGRIDANGKLLNPKNTWGGIMRNIDQTDFETGNVEFIEMWVKDPFINKPASTGGDLYFDLGNISEDILKDGKRQYENGLPTPKTQTTPVDETTVWGKTPSNPIQVTNAFSTDPDERPFQDVGYDGLPDTAEATKFKPYLDNLSANFGTNSQVYQNALKDPSADNFVNYRDDKFDQNNGILERYKNINNPNGNSPIANNSSQFLNAFTLYPDEEDLNNDNTLNEVEEYFQYRVELKPDMQVGTNFITDKRVITGIKLPNGSTRDETWYLFRIPISQYSDKIGNIPDFKSIRFIRMFMTGFEDTTVLRFGKLELVRNQWRNFNYEIDTTGNYNVLPANNPAKVDVLAVNVEENDRRQPINYVIPPGILRQQQLSNNNVNIFQNEQAISLKISNLPKDESRGVFKTMSLDLRQYGSLQMFVHAESVKNQSDLQNDELNAVVRIGSDFVSNYYEIKIPLKISQWYDSSELNVWPQLNNLDFDLKTLTDIKIRRNKSLVSPSQYYSETIDGRTFAMIGNPNLGEVRGMMLAVQNKKNTAATTEVWFNELRLSNLDEKGGWAALGRVDLTLADLGRITMSGSARSAGFGTLEQKVNERSRENFYQFDVAADIDAGKLLPQKLGLQVPLYAGISKTSATPEYDPYDLDILLKDKLNGNSKSARDSIRADAANLTTIKTLTLTNVKFNKVNSEKKLRLWDISNFDFNYSKTVTESQNPLIEKNQLSRTRGAIAYNYAPRAKFIEPFKNIIKSKSKWLTPVKDFNFNFIPSQLSVKADVFRQFGAIRPRNVGGPKGVIPETYDKYFTFDRFYVLRWDITRSINFDYSATNNARIDEPAGRIDTKSKKDSVRNNLFKGGRNTRYHQDATLAYTLPTAKFPLLDWTTFRATYRSEYDWIGASLLAKNQGNTITNGQTKTGVAEFNFDQLYNKSKFYQRMNAPTPPPPPVPDSELGKRIDSLKKVLEEGKLVKKEKRKAKKLLKKLERQLRKQSKQPKEIPSLVKGATNFITSVKRIGIDYTENSGTSLPGYLDSTKILGQNWNGLNPGLGFVFGYQPDTSWINNAGNKGVLTKDPIFNALIEQRYNQNLKITAQVSPFRDFDINFNIDRQFSKNYSELYKDTSTNSSDKLRRYNPYAAGSFKISYISFQTLFGKFDPNVVSQTFLRFQDNRKLLSEKLGKLNPYSGPAPTPGADGYYEGYGRYAQDVLIPAFLGAYTNKDPLGIKLIKNENPTLRSNPFKGLLPKPNWSFTYNGLSRMSGLDKIFTNVTIRHGYNSSLSMNSFNTALFFQDPFNYSFPSFKDTLTGNYVPFFFVPNITISEEFGPLFGIDMSFTNQLSLRFEYRKSRQLSLSLVDYQLAEQRSTGFTVGFDWRQKGMPIIKKLGKMKLDNDVTFKFDMSIRDDATANSKLDQQTAFGTAGQKVIRINPTIDYIVNSRVRATLYFEQTRNIPKIATSAPITNTRAGLQLRISLN